MHHTGKKESKKEILKKDKKNNVTKNLKLFGNSNPDPPNQLELKDNASTHWTILVPGATRLNL